MRIHLVAYAVTAAVLTAAPSTVEATSTPSPDTLKAALADPGSSGYVEATPGTTGVLEGSFDAATYARTQTSDTSKQAQVVNQLTVAGFVTGYGRAWVKTGGGAAVVEEILVFGNNQGATSEFGASKLADVANPAYQAPLDTSKIPQSYGVKFKESSAYASGAVWVKGNDLLVVVLVSAAGYPDQQALAQAQKEDSLAPSYTIQPPKASQPTNQSSGATRIVLIAVIGLLLVALIAVAILLFNRSRRARSLAGANSGGGPAPSVAMSPDGRFWWDGRAWQDVNLTAPVNAPRSPDGAFWWDGVTWRPVPRGYS